RPEVAVLVLLEVIPIDDDGGLRLPLPAFLLLGLVVRIEILAREDEALRVGRPREVADAALHVGELLRLAAGAVQEPDLRALLLLLLVAARGEECQIAAVRA